MLTTQPHLWARQPSPTTVEYVVSTSPSYSLPVRLLLLTTFLLRILTGLAVLLVLYSKFALSSYSSAPVSSAQVPDPLTREYIWYLVATTSSSRVGVQATYIAARAPLAVLLPAGLLVLYLILRRMHTTESLLVLRGLGIQTSTSSNTYLGSATTRFIPTEKIQDIFVNEAFRGFEVRYYLVVVVAGEDDVVVVFPRLLPRRHIVEKVWRGARACLYEPVGDESKKA